MAEFKEHDRVRINDPGHRFHDRNGWVCNANEPTQTAEVTFPQQESFNHTTGRWKAKTWSFNFDRLVKLERFAER